MFSFLSFVFVFSLLIRDTAGLTQVPDLLEASVERTYVPIFLIWDCLAYMAGEVASEHAWFRGADGSKTGCFAVFSCRVFQ